jgi:hypothetical protein
MNPTNIRNITRTAVVCGAMLCSIAGCNKKADNTINYTNAINTYYSAHPACLWPEEIRFPVQADTSDTSKTSGYDALVDQGLLVRTTAEKKKFILGSKQVTNYDLSDKGRSAWTADPNQPGFGNFCYGHRKVSSIDSATPNTGETGAIAQVTYHYSFSDAPDWAKAPETQTAYPRVRDNLATPQAGQATLTDTSSGWIVSSAPSTSIDRPVSNPDGAVVR